MAVFKIQTNALLMADMFEHEITYEELGNLAQAGLGNATDATGKVGAAFPFDYYVQRYWLSGQAMNVGNEDTASFQKRGWHHREMFKIWLPKTAQRQWKREKHAGFYSGRYSLNYLLKNLRRTGNEKFLSEAWKGWQGAANTKAELAWMFERGLTNMAKKYKDKLDNE